ncbi:MAG: 3-phosphoshikimate 1-carboxyvinyltransferase [Planctomycetota bacterium]
MDRCRIFPKGPLVGRTRVVGSKSLTIRALEASALARGSSVIAQPADCDDVDVFVRALRDLGITIDPGDELSIEGSSGQLSPKAEVIDLGPAGTPFRFAMGLAALGNGPITLDGTERMRERPVGPLTDALRALGARVDYLGIDGYPPVRVSASGNLGDAVTIHAGESSQYLSALLLIGPVLPRGLRIELSGSLASAPYVELTLEVMRAFGAESSRDAGSFYVPPTGYRGARYVVPGDASSAAYFFAAAAITGGDVTVLGLGDLSAQGDFGLLEVLETMGCRVERGTGEVRVIGPDRLHGLDVDLNAMPDQVPTVAVLAAVAEGTTRIRNVAHLRLKESDRLEAVATGLRAAGIEATVLEDGLRIKGGHPERAEIDTRDDHRMVMAFSVLSLHSEPMTIWQPGCVSKSFRRFFDCLEGLGVEIESLPGGVS